MMRLSVGEMADLCGVSVRTLHYYGQIGLLFPAVGDAGYRWYGEADVERMQQILFYRELDFPLKDIREILADPQYDKQEALRRQRRLLTLKRDRLDRLLELLEAGLEGDETMEKTTDYETVRRQYADEAKRRWGDTAAWRESRTREKTRSAADQEALSGEMDGMLRRFAALRRSDPAGAEARAAVADWQAFLTANYYACSREMLAELGAMYAEDPRFRKNLDRFGAGTAAFMSAAVAAYCAS